jgi:hypothetical protein
VQITLRKVGMFVVAALTLSFGKVMGDGAFQVVTGRPVHHVYTAPPAPVADTSPPGPVAGVIESLLLGQDNEVDSHLVRLDDAQTLAVRRMVIESLSDREVVFGKNMLAVRGLKGSRQSMHVCGTILDRERTRRVFMALIEVGYEPEVQYGAEIEKLCIEVMRQNGIDPNG